MLGNQTETGSSVGASSLLSFVPRAVMLESSYVARGVSAVTSEKTKKKKKEKKDSAVVTASLFRAISCFLERKGLTKTLAALRSEAQLDINDGCGVPALDLVEMVRKYLELRGDSAVEKLEKREDDYQVNEESVHNPLEKPISKKKKEPKKSAKQTDKDSSKHASESGTDDVMKSNEQKKKKEKKKRSESSEAQGLADETMKDAVALPELNGKSDHNKNDKKKKKKKAGELEKGEDERSSPIICEDKSNKKKRKHESSNESEVHNGINSQTKKDDNLQNDSISLSMEAKKHKILPSEESENLASNGSSKSKMSEKKHSTTAANAFQRVKVDAVEFVDERLQDNSYWAKDGAETGYGAKAQEVLGQVRGRDFRHEKTKKKRGSYRGGQIDFQSHSVKFQYSDEDE